MNPPKLLGVSWRTSLAGLIVFLAGSGTILLDPQYIDILPHAILLWVKLICGLAGVAAIAWGLNSAKDKTVTGIVTNNPATTTATNDPTLDGTAKS